MKLLILSAIAASIVVVATPVVTQAKTVKSHKLMKHSRHIGTGGRMPASRNF